MRGAAAYGIRMPNHARRTTIPSALIAIENSMGFELRGSQAEVKSLQNRTRRKGGKGVKAARAFAEPRITHFLDISAKNDDSWGETPSGEAISWAIGNTEAPPT